MVCRSDWQHGLQLHQQLENRKQTENCFNYFCLHVIEALKAEISIKDGKPFFAMLTEE